MPFKKKYHCVPDGSKSPIYNSWFKMIQRCTDPKNKDWKHYGGRGIMVCNRWFSFDLFVADMGGTWRQGLTLERRDNNDNYYPANCQWSTRAEQSQNTRRNHWITLNGVTMTLGAWSKLLQVSRTTLYSRLTKLKWPVEKALS